LRSVAISSTVRDARQKHPTDSYIDKGSSGHSSARSAAPQKPCKVWIVDYDLPQGNERRSFYRAVQKLLAERNPGEHTGWSTRSVVITDDEEFAWFVYKEAVKIGKAHLYK